MIGELDGTRLIGSELLAELRRPHSSGLDQVLRLRTDFGLGFMLPGGPLFPTAAGPGTFGHGGATGSFALADPDRGLTLGYVPNRGSELLEGNDLRINNLVAALY